jgi:hypothetical protein
MMFCLYSIGQESLEPPEDATSFENSCTIHSSYGNKTVLVLYNGSYCGNSSDWISYENTGSGWQPHNSSSSYGDLKVGDFSCCLGPA